ncbi:squalene/phytoene synthase family protein [Bacillus subtilis subsp. subtilis]|nr:squalene/phytoene synthase family protein [Bacillus subtilis subsp. subtilis]
MTTSSALDSFLDKWRTRWPEWSVAEPFVPEAQRSLVVAWFALLQEFDDILNTSGDPMPADAKLAWWGEELRSWAGQRSRHPLGRLLEPVRAPWAALADTLPDLIEARAPAMEPAQALGSLHAYAAAVAAVEAVVFDTPARGDVAGPVLLQTLAQRLHEAGVAAVPRSLLANGQGTAAQQWAQQLLARWPARIAGPRPRRMYASLARTRLQASAHGRELKVTPMRTLLRTWWAGRG